MATLKNTIINDTGYLKLPTGTTAQRPASPLVGYSRFNTTIKKMETWNGAKWQEFPAQVEDYSLVVNYDVSNSSCYPGSGSTLTNLGTFGSANNMTLVNGPTYTSEYGGGIVFDGVNDYATLGDRNNLDLTAITLDLWIKRPTPTAQYARIFQTGDTTGYMNGFILGANATADLTKLIWVVQENYQTSERIHVTQIPLPNNSIFNVTVTFTPMDYDGGGSRMYVNGTKVHSIMASPVTAWVSSSNTMATMAARSGGGFNFSSMTMYKTMIYNRALSPKEVELNFQANRGRFGI